MALNQITFANTARYHVLRGKEKLAATVLSKLRILCLRSIYDRCLTRDMCQLIFGSLKSQC